MARNFYEDEEIKPVEGQKIVNGVLVDSPQSVQSVFKSVRQSIYNVYSSSVDYVNSGYDKYHKTERSVTTTVSELHDKNEDLVPNGIYVIVGALSGTVMSRQRGILSKITFPVIMGLVSFKYFLPQTFNSTKNFVWKLEKKTVPEIAHQQENLYNKSSQLIDTIETTADKSSQSISSSIDSLRTNIKKYTGLNLDDEATKK
ncbi:MICOS subunit Mic26p [[Candida] jaroonii]|uniref:MICOS subunit Mic26p n=1 Tax=[Candida] jaroonii TaxID=467808 RepID=A0ACA9YC78_9ASCO|nr:MICOS subunit Mic26p [[Candida] jaroonii]